MKNACGGGVEGEEEISNTVEHQFYVPGFYVPIDLMYQFKIPCMREVDLMLENLRFCVHQLYVQIEFMYRIFKSLYI